MPKEKAYIIHPTENKNYKIKNDIITGKNKTKNRNLNYYYNDKNYNIFNTIHAIRETPSTNLNLTKQKSFSEIAQIENNLLENKENIVPNNNNPFNNKTICNNSLVINRIHKVPTDMKLYRNYSKHLPDGNNLTNYNITTKLTPLTELDKQYTFKLEPNNHSKFVHSLNRTEKNHFYTFNGENVDENQRKDFFKENNPNMFKLQKPKNLKKMRENFIKITPQYDNNSNINTYKNLANNKTWKYFNYYQDKRFSNKSFNKENINDQNIYDNISKDIFNQNKSFFQIEGNYILNESKKENNSQISKISENNNKKQIINDLMKESLNSNNIFNFEQNKIIRDYSNNQQKSQNINSSKIIKIPLPQKNNNYPDNKNAGTINPIEQNNNLIMMQNNIQNKANIHFPIPEQPVRKESKSSQISNPNSSNVIYNVFNASGWLKNYAVLTNPGCDKTGNQKTNQDSFVFKTNINNINNFNIFGVMDGHGPQGHFVSQFVSKFIPFQITNHRDIKTLNDPEEIYNKLKYNEYEIINNIFQETDNQLRKVNFDANESGCTCVLIIHIGSHIICANTGDSRAILISDSVGNNNINDFFEVALSYDYKPEMPEEKQRIESFGGVVEQLKNKLGEGVGPYRVWAKGEGYPGLAMSRSIGDLVGKKLGVIPNPGILEYDLTKNVKYIVVASDGIWEFLSNEMVKEAGKKYYRNNNPNGFCHEIVKVAYKIWKENGITVDDITAIAAFF